MTNQSEFNLNVKWNIGEEILRQARLSFNLAIIATTISFSITIIGVGLLLSGEAPSGTVASALGLVPSLKYIELAKNMNDRLDRYLILNNRKSDE